MPPYVPGFTAAEVRRAFRNDGWIIRQGGGHTHAEKGGLKVSIPRHGGKDIPPGTMGGIIVQAGWTAGEFRNLVRGRNRDGSRRTRNRQDA